MASATGRDIKNAAERLSDDEIVTTGPQSGTTASHGSLVAPPLVAAMTADQRLQAEAKMRRKIDTRLLPMIILMYIMNCEFIIIRQI